MLIVVLSVILLLDNLLKGCIYWISIGGEGVELLLENWIELWRLAGTRGGEQGEWFWDKMRGNVRGLKYSAINYAI